MKRVIIVGGGIAGLAAAYRLLKTAPEAQITLTALLERPTRA